MTILDDIAARKREDVAARASVRSEDQLRAACRARTDHRDFTAAIARPGLSLIAEIKHRSPSKGVLRSPFDPAEIARAYDGRAAAISVLCDAPYFGGDLAHLAIARRSSSAPLLAKDFVLGPYQVFEASAAGADCVLLIAKLLDDATLARCQEAAREAGVAALLEVHDEDELTRALRTPAPIIGINTRDLATLKIDPGLIAQLAPKARAQHRLVVAESGIQTRDDVDRLRPLADAVLIGSTFMESHDIPRALESLGWSR